MKKRITGETVWTPRPKAAALLIGAFVLASAGGLIGCGKSRQGVEASTKGALEALRLGLSMYNGKQGGQYPASLNQLYPRFIANIPPASTVAHGELSEVEGYGGEVCAGGKGALDGSKLKDTGRWGYVNDKNSPCWGHIFVDCTHSDLKGAAWYTR